MPADDPSPKRTVDAQKNGCRIRGSESWIIASFAPRKACAGDAPARIRLKKSGVNRCATLSMISHCVTETVSVPAYMKAWVRP